MKSCRTLAVTALAAGAMIVATSSTTVQAQEPFSGIPRAADVLIRVDMESLGATPALAPIVNELSALSPVYQNIFFEKAAEDTPAVASVMKNFPGTVKVYEMGVLMESMQGDTPQAFMVATGDFDAQALHQRLTSAEGWTEGSTMAGTKIFKAPEDTDTVLTMPNASTLLMAPSEGAMGDLVASYAASTPSARDGKLASMVNQHGSAPVFIGFQLPAEAKKMLAEMSQNPPAEAAMIPGGPALIAEVAALEGAVLTLGGQGADAMLGLALNFGNAEAAGRASTALNQMIPGAAMMAKMQVGQDPEANAQIDRLKDLRFSQNGTGISVQIPVPPDQLQMAIAGIQEAAQGGMMPMMGGGGQGQMNFYD